MMQWALTLIVIGFILLVIAGVETRRARREFREEMKSWRERHSAIDHEQPHK